MIVAKLPSVVTVPPAARAHPTILEFLCARFPGVARERWARRMREGRVLDDAGRPLAPDAGCVPGRRIHYFREVEAEPVIPFAERILFQDAELVVACKPHFLPVTPGGRFVEECLLNRLRARTGIDDLAPLHRIDRETAGVVVFSANRATRGRYAGLFVRGEVEKSYEALARLRALPQQERWTVENRIVRGEPRFRMQVVPGAANARSTIHLVEANGDRARFRLHPHTGKTHQLRLHLSGLGFPIVNDRIYPELRAESADDLARPLQLLAGLVRFRDPVSGADMEFRSERELSW
jgi:tRNA pseudouridine32 synthase/23S rRNA pseudouridine746 synthase